MTILTRTTYHSSALGETQLMHNTYQFADKNSRYGVDLGSHNSLLGVFKI